MCQLEKYHTKIQLQNNNYLETKMTKRFDFWHFCELTKKRVYYTSP